MAASKKAQETELKAVVNSSNESTLGDRICTFTSRSDLGYSSTLHILEKVVLMKTSSLWRNRSTVFSCPVSEPPKLLHP
eukprot:snap_masked-scaffold_6-processed-gene-19.9-mRNA-1 protein AED:1.00 eAED:1.00 QI:0/-1/0/0/-1/1/1/0/78